MEIIPLRKRKSTANITSLTLTQGAVPALNVIGLPGVLTNSIVSWLRKNLLIGSPEIAVGNTTTLCGGNFVP